MIDPSMRAMFQSAVLPTIKLMSTEEIVEIRTFLLGELDEELSRRQIIETIEAARASELPPGDEAA